MLQLLHATSQCGSWLFWLFHDTFSATQQMCQAVFLSFFPSSNHLSLPPQFTELCNLIWNRAALSQVTSTPHSMSGCCPKSATLNKVCESAALATPLAGPTEHVGPAMTPRGRVLPLWVSQTSCSPPPVCTALTPRSSSALLEPRASQVQVDRLHARGTTARTLHAAGT